MSALPIIIIIVGIIVSIARKTMGQQQQQPPRQQMPPRQVPTRPSSEKQQSAWEWMHGEQADAKDPEGETQMYRDVPEEWIHPVETSVRMDLTELQESQHEIVHATVRESIHVRRDRVAEAANESQATPKKKHKIALNSSNLSQAIILSEVLGEPRSKRPWNPRGKR